MARRPETGKATSTVVAPTMAPYVLWPSPSPGDPVYLNPHVLTAMESNWHLEDHSFESPMFTETALEKHLLNTVFCLEAVRACSVAIMGEAWLAALTGEWDGRRRTCTKRRRWCTAR